MLFEAKSKKMISIPENNFGTISKDVVSQELGIPPMFVDKLIGKFLETIDDNINDLKEAINSKNAEEIKNKAHKIKGSSANLRFKFLAELLKVIEYAGREGITEGYDEILEKTIKEIEEIKNIFQ